MAITKFTDVADSGYDIAINKDATFQSERDKFLQGLVTKIDELTDLLNSHITDMAANNAKTGITTAQANAITANTAKTSFPGLGTTSTTALAGDTKLISLGSTTTYAFSELVENRGVFTIRLTATNRGVTKVLDLRLV